jgi:hypothetical protein
MGTPAFVFVAGGPGSGVPAVKRPPRPGDGEYERDSCVDAR